MHSSRFACRGWPVMRPAIDLFIRPVFETTPFGSLNGLRVKPTNRVLNIQARNLLARNQSIVASLVDNLLMGG
jgi:hypothetical protein